VNFTPEQEMRAFAIASEHVTYERSRDVPYEQIAQSVGLPDGLSRMVLIARLGRLWLEMQEQ